MHLRRRFACVWPNRLVMNFSMAYVREVDHVDVGVRQHHARQVACGTATPSSF
jgi:hypothetical protein